MHVGVLFENGCLPSVGGNKQSLQFSYRACRKNNKQHRSPGHQGPRKKQVVPDWPNLFLMPRDIYHRRLCVY